MDPIQFLRLAEALLHDHAHPAGWRIAVSRAYYAAHHVTKEFVEGAGCASLAVRRRMGTYGIISPM
jgi:hypothetical protein